MASSIDAEVIYPIRARLGEGSIWDEQSQRLYWVDIMGCKVHCFNPSNRSNLSYDVGAHVGTVVLADDGNIVVALPDGMATLDPSTGHVTPGTRAETNKPNNRFNDGKCDPRGRFWVGSMAYDCAKGAASLYCFDHTGGVSEKISGVTISNGLVWTADETIFYYIDSPTCEIHGYDYDAETGNISNKRVIKEFERDGSVPDGMCIDSDDKLWVAFYGGSKVLQVDPLTGDVGFQVNLSARNITSCAFGGPDLNQLYITSASGGMTEEDFKNCPSAGSLFRADVPATGVVANRFRAGGST